jgi:hypothetical protein
LAGLVALKSNIRARVNAGIARAKAQGKHCGRPTIKLELAQAIRDALAVRTAGIS